jgi:hypothetical protein
MVVLHNINEEDSDLEKGSDEEVNKTFDYGQNQNRQTFTVTSPDVNKSFSEIKKESVSYQNTPEKEKKHYKFHSMDLTKFNTQKLKQIIHTQSRLEKEEKEKEEQQQKTKTPIVMKPLNLGALEHNHEVYNTPRFEEEELEHNNKQPEIQIKRNQLLEERKSGELQSLNEKIQNLKQQNSNVAKIMSLDESGLLEYSMEMQKQFRGLLGDANESSVVNESFNNSRVAGHRRQYSTDQSVLFGKEYLNDTLDQSMTGEDNQNVNTSNFLNLKDLFTDGIKNEPESQEYDFEEQEKEFKRLFDDNEVDESNRFSEK